MDVVERRLILKELPESLFPDPNSNSIPPTYYLGWNFDSRRIVALSRKHRIAVYDREVIDPDASDDEPDPDDPDSYIALGIERNFNVAFTATAVAKYLFQTAGFHLPIARPINIVWTPEGALLALSLCDNFTYNNRPTDVQLADIQGVFGFPEPPVWMLSGLKHGWSRRDVRLGRR